MSPSSLTEEEFRVLAYVRSYADGPDQHLDPNWVKDQLSLSTDQMLMATRELQTKGLAEICEFGPPDDLLRLHPELVSGVTPTDICLTRFGWDLLRKDHA